MINESKQTPSIANSTKINTGETWASIATTWASETRTWLQVGSFLTNTTKISSNLINQAKP